MNWIIDTYSFSATTVPYLSMNCLWILRKTVNFKTLWLLTQNWDVTTLILNSYCIPTIIQNIKYLQFFFNNNNRTVLFRFLFCLLHCFLRLQLKYFVVQFILVCRYTNHILRLFRLCSLSPDFQNYQRWLIIKPARSAGFSQIKKIPSQAPPTQLGPQKCKFCKNAFLGPKYQC